MKKPNLSQNGSVSKHLIQSNMTPSDDQILDKAFQLVKQIKTPRWQLVRIKASIYCCSYYFDQHILYYEIRSL